MGGRQPKSEYKTSQAARDYRVRHYKANRETILVRAREAKRRKKLRPIVRWAVLMEQLLKDYYVTYKQRGSHILSIPGEERPGPS